MHDATLYLFDGYNLLHAGPLSDRAALVDRLASFVAFHGARGIVVFDGAGDDAELGPLSVRFAPDADTVLERLAVRHRRTGSGETLLHDLLPRPRPARAAAWARRRARRQAR
jgi:predicted RNA-binding protein with PIN domain